MTGISDFGKEVKETFQNRAKSPIFGSVFLAFIGFNWRALFYLFFDKTKTVSERIGKFDQLTDGLTLILWPFVGR